MRRTELKFRITKVANKAVSVAVCALTGLAFGPVIAEEIRYTGDSSAEISRTDDQNSIEIRATNSDGASTAFSYSGRIMLDGLRLTGENGYAVFTRQLQVGLNATDNVNFGTGSNLLLIGTVDLNGRVGVNVANDINNWNIDPIDLITVTGNSTFSGEVFANTVSVTGGTDVRFNKDLGGSWIETTNTSTINTNSHNTTITFADNANLTGGLIKNANSYGSSLVFEGSSIITGTVGGSAITAGNVASDRSLSTIQIQGGSDKFVRFATNVITSRLNFTSNGVVAVLGDLLLNREYDPLNPNAVQNAVTFNGNNATLQIGGNLTGVEGKQVVSVVGNNLGTLTMLSGTQTITGGIGAEGASIRLLNIGGAYDGVSPAIGSDMNDPVSSITTANGNIYATTTTLNNNGTTTSSRLDLAAGSSIFSRVRTADGGMGELRLLGGSQTVDGNVGGEDVPAANLDVPTARLDRVVSGYTLVGGSTTTFTGNVFADTVSAAGLDNGAGIATGTGTTNFQGNVGATTVIVGNGISNFSGSVVTTPVGEQSSPNFTSLNTNDGLLIGTGVANFSATGTADTNLVFTATSAVNQTTSTTANLANSGLGSATANLRNGLTGTVSFGGFSGTVNVWDGKGITGAITTVTNSNTGTVNFLGDGTLGGAVGATTLGIASLNVNTSSDTVNRQTVVNGRVAGNGVLASGGLFLGEVNLANSGKLTLANTVNLMGTTAANANVTSLTGLETVVKTASNGTGELEMLGNSMITGGVGTSAARLAQIAAGVGTTTTTLNNTSYATTLLYRQDGTVVLNGQTGVGTRALAGANLGVHTNTVAHSGFFGTVDFGVTGATPNSGTLRIGDQVNLTVAPTGGSTSSATEFANTTNATLRFDGTSFVTNDLGSASNRFKDIYAGATAGSTVTFVGTVFVQPSSFHVSGTGVVNFASGLNGALVYDENGSVNVGDGSTITGPVTTTAASRGTLNFLGSTTLQAPIGEENPGFSLAQVNFHSAAAGAVLSVSSDDETVNIGQDVYAGLTTIGRNAGAGIGTTTANILNVAGVANSGPFLGNALTLGSATTLNTAGAVTTATHLQVDSGAAISLVDFQNTPNNTTGTLSLPVVTQSTTGTGAITTQGATLNFAVATSPWAANAGGQVNQANSSQIIGGDHSTLVMTGAESVNISLLGSLRHGVTYSLIVTEGVGGGNTAIPGTVAPGVVRDNSFIIETSLSRVGPGADLRVTTSRAADVYVDLSNTANTPAELAALRLGALGRAGTGYGSDMQVVFNKLDIDQWGFGNNEANLATQVRRLIPIVNGSDIHSAFSATSAALTATSDRLAVLRGDSKMAGLDGNGRSLGSNETGWAKVLGGTGKGESIDGYDGFTTDMYGLSLGFDTRISNGVIGLMGHISNSDIKQQDFRSGDSADLQTAGLGIYATQEYGPVFVEGTLAYANHSLESKRAAVVGRTATADVDYKQTSARLAAGYRFALDSEGKSILTPILAVEYGRIKQDAYVETGAGDIGLEVDSRSVNRTRSSLGLRFATEVQTASGVFYPDLYVGYNKTSGLNNTSLVANYIGDTAKEDFTIVGVTPKKSSYTVAAGLRYAVGKNSEVQLGYKFEGDKNLKSHQASLRAAWAF